MEKFDKYAFPLLMGALNLYYLSLVLFIVFLFVTFNGEMFHSMPNVGPALLVYHPITPVLLLVGGIAGLFFRLKLKAGKTFSDWGFTGKWLTLTCFVLCLLLLTAAEFILPRPKLNVDVDAILQTVMTMQETKDINVLIDGTKNISPDVRITALNRLIPGRYNRVHFTDEQAAQIASIFMNALKDPHSQVRDLALSYTDDIVTGEIGKKYYTSMDKLNIRRIYQKAILSDDHLNRESALLNIGNLMQVDDPKGPVFFRKQLMECYSSMKLKPETRSKLLERDLLFAANFSAESFPDLVNWTIEEVLSKPDLDSRIWREAVKFISKFDVPLTQDHLKKMLEAETDEAKKLFISDCIKFKGVLPLTMESSEVQMEMKLKEERMKERMNSSGKSP